MPEAAARAAPVLLIGDPRLRREARPASSADPGLPADAARLVATLDDFRAKQGFGRAIAAPQIGCDARMLAIRLPGWPEIVLNPEIVSRGARTLTLWDDCMSFPFLVVRVRRAASVRVRYQELDGSERTTSELDVATSELLQHEIDHLDGVLALDRAIDRDSIVAREVFERDVTGFRALVDFAPGD